MRMAVLVLAVVGIVLGAPARAQTPTTIAPDLFAFPGAHRSPATATSAGLALADRWLGEPFANPAIAHPTMLVLTPMLLHVSRQDLRADHRGFKEQSGFFDAAGGAFSFESGRWGVALYGYQPAVRIEDNLFQTGSLLTPGLTETNSEMREVRGGLAVSLGFGHARVGVAGEWMHRADRYERVERTGGGTNTYSADFSGDGAGGQAGFRMIFGEGPGSWTLGAAARYIAELDLSGSETLGNVSGTTTSTISAKREAGWEGGFSTRYVITDAFQAVAALGGGSGQSFEPFTARSGPSVEVRVAGEYHDARDPWTVRFGFGQEQQTEVPEPRTAVVGLGIGFEFETTRIDFGVLHRSFKRPDHPASAEDRLVVSLAQRF